MPTLIRPLIEGELWWSALSRHAATVLPSGPVMRHLALAGNKRSLGSPLFPRQLQMLSVRLGLEITPQEVIREHSLLPYYSPFLDPRKVTRAIGCMMTNGNVEFMLGVAPMRDYPVWLKTCPRCMENDLEIYGMAPWHRAHQAPGVVVCAEHGCSLVEAKCPARALSQIAPLKTAEETEVRCCLPVPNRCYTDALWLAEQAQRLMEGPTVPVARARLTGLYRHRLAERGYITNKGRLQQTALLRGFSARFGLLFDFITCDRPNAAFRDNWLARLFSDSAYDQSPLRHLLAMRFLELDALAALKAAEDTEPFVRSIPHARPAFKRSRRITPVLVARKREKWLALGRAHPDRPLRQRSDALYCWLWRNDRAWLRNDSTRRRPS